MDIGQSEKGKRKIPKGQSNSYKSKINRQRQG